MVWSHTRISLWHECPFAWKCRYLDHLPEAPGEAFHNGRRFHEAVSEYATHCHKIGRSSDYEVGEQISERYADLPDVASMVYDFSRNWHFDVDHMIGLEHDLVADLPCGDRFRGVIDYLSIDGTEARITDWKSWHSWPEYDEARVPTQLSRYAWLVAQNYPQVEVVRVALLFVRFGVLQEWEVWQPDCEEIVQAVEWIKREADSADARRFSPTPGAWCGLCGFTKVCPVGSAIIPEGDVQLAAEKLTVLDAEREGLRALAQAWAKENGPIPVQGGAWSYAPPDDPAPKIADMDGLLAYLSSQDVDWLGEASFSAATLRRWVKQFPDAEQYLEPGEGKPTFRFRRDKGEAAPPSREIA